MEAQDGEPIPDDGRSRFGREPPAPPASRYRVPYLGVAVLEVEPK
jgi:hypothetical protein